MNLVVKVDLVTVELMKKTGGAYSLNINLQEFNQFRGQMLCGSPQLPTAPVMYHGKVAVTTDKMTTPFIQVGFLVGFHQKSPLRFS